MSSNSTAEYEAITLGCGLLELKSRGYAELTGPGAAEFLQGQITNDIENCDPGTGVYAALLTPKGRIRMDLRALRTEDGVLVDFASDRSEILFQTIQKFKIGYKFETADRSGQTRILALIGPAADSVLPGLGASPHAHMIVTVAQAEVRAVRTDWGIDLIVPTEDVSAVKEELAERGAVSISEATAEIRRVELGKPMLGREFSDDEIPQELRLNDVAVNFQKGCYVGQETVARLFYKGKPNRLLQGLRLSAPAASGDVVMDGDRQVGVIGTAVESPRVGPIALAVLRHEVGAGDQVTVGDQQTSATIVDPSALAQA